MFSESDQVVAGVGRLIWGARGRRFKSYRPDQIPQLRQTLTGDLPFLFSGRLKTNSIETQNPFYTAAHPNDADTLYA